MTRDHSEALESDFHRVYGLDLLDVWRGRLPVSLASIRAVNLPRGSQVWVGLDYPQAWTVADELAAHSLRELQLIDWRKTKQGQKGTNPPKFPMHIPGEEISTAAKSMYAARQGEKFLARQAEKAAAEATTE